MLDRNGIDIMLEVKDKNLSCVKCINCTNYDVRIIALEKEWSRYKYTILERSHSDYLENRKLIKDKHNFSAVYFYNFLESGHKNQGDTGSLVNGALHVCGILKIRQQKKKRKISLNI